MRVSQHIHIFIRRFSTISSQFSTPTIIKTATKPKTIFISKYNTMKTEVIKVDFKHFQFKEDSSTFFSGQNATPLITSTHDKEAINKAVAWLKQGEAIGIPTETVYGLAANALDAEAVSKIFAAKNRPQDNPLIVHISSISMLESILPDGKIPSVYLPVIKKCWPGPLTIIVPTSLQIPTSVTCGQPTVAVRFPSHPVARALIDACGFPLAAPSANSSGKPSPTLASHVFDDLEHKIPLILDGGLCNVGLESTVLDGLRNPPAILRPGGATYEMLKSIEGMEGLQVYRKHFVDQALELAPTTPGMKYRHYSPEAMVILIEKKESSSSPYEFNKTFDSAWKKELKNLLDNGIGVKKVGILKTVNDENEDYQWRNDFTEEDIEYVTLQMGRHDHPEEVARGMFKGLRELDSTTVDIIFVQGVSETMEGMAIMNRLSKAASKIIAL